MRERDERLPIPVHTPPTIALIAAGGALGALARYAILAAFPGARDGFPAGTLVVNIAGSLLLGAALGWFETPRGQRAPLWLRPFAIAGFAGAFTTLSLVVVDHTILITAGRSTEALAFAFVTLIGTIVVAALGTVIGRAIGNRQPSS